MSRIHLPSGTPDRLRVSLRVAGQSDRLFGTSDSNAQSWRARHAQHASPSEGQKSHVHSRFHVGDVRRSPGASAKGRLLGQRESYRAARRLRRSETVRGSDRHGYHRYHRVDTRIVRIFNTYGPRMRLRDGRVVPAFIGQALSGQPLSVFGDGSQTRSFCYVSDLIDGIFRLAMSDFHEPVNLGNPREMTIKQFAEEIIRITGTKSTIEYKPLPVDDPKVRQPDIAARKKPWTGNREFSSRKVSRRRSTTSNSR